MIALLLTLSVACLWLAAWGFIRLGSAYDRLHCASFASVAALPPLVIAAFVADGASDRAFKLLLLAGLSFLCGAVQTHAIGRATALRDAWRDQT